LYLGAWRLIKFASKSNAWVSVFVKAISILSDD